MNPEYVLSKVAEWFNISKSRILGNGRAQYVANPRSIGMWVCRNVLGITYQDIGKVFRRDHSTVMTACDKVSSRLRTDTQFADELDEIVRFIDPRHKILETKYRYVLEGHELDDLPNLVNKILDYARHKNISTIDVTFNLLRGSAPPKPPSGKVVEQPQTPPTRS